jgi:polysaccharide deacetylase family protein (PEP-CTERM system associated)
VDLEDWFHICEVEELVPRATWDRLPSSLEQETGELLHLLESAGCRATFFVLGYVAERHPGLVQRIHRAGHEIAYHGWDHELVYELTPEKFRKILKQGIECLEDLTGKRPAGFRAPQWSINDRSLWALEILAEEGFLYDSSMTPLKVVGNEDYPKVCCTLQTPAGPIAEFPPFTTRGPGARYPAGGGWGLRILPFPLLRRAVRHVNRKGAPAVFYFHPREFGPPHKIPGLPRTKRFVLHGGVWSSRAQLQKILRVFHFRPMVDFLDSPALHPPLARTRVAAPVLSPKSN